MKRPKCEPPASKRFKLPHLLLGLAALYLVFISFKFPEFLEGASILSGDDSYIELDGTKVEESEVSDLTKPFFGSVYKETFHRKLEDNQNQDAPVRPSKEPWEEGEKWVLPFEATPTPIWSKNWEIMRRRNRTSDLSVLERMADEAWTLGLKVWEELDKLDGKETIEGSIDERKPESCLSWLMIGGDELAMGDKMMFLPCGLAAGTSITIVGAPHYSHQEFIPQLAKSRRGDALVMVSQFMIELQGLKAVDGEDPPKILYFNPRLKGDWSQRPVIERNTCYSLQWGSAQRCDGLPSKSDDNMLVDGHRRCKK